MVKEREREREPCSIGEYEVSLNSGNPQLYYKWHHLQYWSNLPNEELAETYSPFQLQEEPNYQFFGSITMLTQ